MKLNLAAGPKLFNKTVLNHKNQGQTPLFASAVQPEFQGLAKPSAQVWQGLLFAGRQQPAPKSILSQLAELLPEPADKSEELTGTQAKTEDFREQEQKAVAALVQLDALAQEIEKQFSLYNDGDLRLLEKVVEAVLTIPDSEIQLQFIDTLLRSPRPNTVEQILAGPISDMQDADLRDQLIEHLIMNANAYVSNSALDLLPFMSAGEHRDSLIRQLAEWQDVPTRQDMALHLALVSDAALRDNLIEALAQDPEAKVRGAALGAIRWMEDVNRRDGLIERLIDTVPDGEDNPALVTAQWHSNRGQRRDRWIFDYIRTFPVTDGETNNKARAVALLGYLSDDLASQRDGLLKELSTDVNNQDPVILKALLQLIEDNLPQETDFGFFADASTGFEDAGLGLEQLDARLLAMTEMFDEELDELALSFMAKMPYTSPELQEKRYDMLEWMLLDGKSPGTIAQKYIMPIRNEQERHKLIQQLAEEDKESFQEAVAYSLPTITDEGLQLALLERILDESNSSTAKQLAARAVALLRNSDQQYQLIDRLLTNEYTREIGAKLAVNVPDEARRNAYIIQCAHAHEEKPRAVAAGALWRLPNEQKRNELLENLADDHEFKVKIALATSEQPPYSDPERHMVLIAKLMNDKSPTVRKVALLPQLKYQVLPPLRAFVSQHPRHLPLVLDGLRQLRPESAVSLMDRMNLLDRINRMALDFKRLPQVLDEFDDLLEKAEQDTARYHSSDNLKENGPLFLTAILLFGPAEVETRLAGSKKDFEEFIDLMTDVLKLPSMTPELLRATHDVAQRFEVDAEILLNTLIFYLAEGRYPQELLAQLQHIAQLKPTATPHAKAPFSESWIKPETVLRNVDEPGLEGFFNRFVLGYLPDAP